MKIFLVIITLPSQNLATSEDSDRGQNFAFLSIVTNFLVPLP